MHFLPQELNEYKENDWTDYQKLKKLKTEQVKQIINRFLILSAKLSVDMVNTNNSAIIFYCETISAVIYCW